MKKSLEWKQTTKGHLLIDGDGNYKVFIKPIDDKFEVYRLLNNTGHSILAENPFCSPIDQEYAIYGNLIVAKQAGYKIAMM